ASERRAPERALPAGPTAGDRTGTGPSPAPAQKAEGWAGERETQRPRQDSARAAANGQRAQGGGESKKEQTAESIAQNKRARKKRE
ncbi:hypothetical protein KI387_027692, partial [Taxus chinensis]